MKKLLILLVLSLGIVINGNIYASDEGPADIYVDSSGVLQIKKPYYTAQPFVIKGVNWSPATQCGYWAKGVPPVIKGVTKDLGDLDPSKTRYYGFFYDEAYPQLGLKGYEVLRYWLRNEIFERYERDLYLIEGMNANTVRIINNLGSTLEDYDMFSDYMTVVLDKCKEDNLMVIMTVAISKEDIDSQKYLDVVNAHKNHPAILMWAIGNEWNFNKFYDDELNLTLAAELVNTVAARIKSEDSYHPVCSILGDKFDDFSTILAKCPNVDIWGANVYRKDGISGFLEQWQALPQAKPVFISEFGTDSFYTEECKLVSSPFVGLKLADEVKGYEDEQRHANIVVSLWNEIKEAIVNKRCLGGVIHEFNDSLWKVGNWHVGLGEVVSCHLEKERYAYETYNDEGFVLLGQLYNDAITNASEKDYVILNEEYFGLVNAFRTPKLAYSAMKEKFAEDISATPNTPPVFEAIIGNKRVEAGRLLRFFVSASDPDGDPVTIQARIPEGITATFTDPGWFNWSPSDDDCGNSYTIIFEAVDSKGAMVSQSVAISVPATPRIDSLTQDSSDARKYIITGNNFGDKQGKENYLIFQAIERQDSAYQIISWSDEKIIFQVNESLKDGFYCVEVHCFKGISNTKCFNYVTPKRIITLKTGWNFVSLPTLADPSYTAAKWIADINSQSGRVTKLQKWDGSGWQTYNAGTPLGDFKVEVGKGYFLLAKKGSTFSITGVSPTTITYTLNSGMNMIGVPFEGYTAKNLSQAVKAQGGKITKVQRWTGSSWQTYNGGVGSGDFKISSTEGIVLYATGISSFTL